MKKFKNILLALVLFSGFLFVLPTSVRASAEEPEIAEALETAEAVQEAGSPVVGPIGIGGGVIAYISQSGELSLTAYDDADDPVLPKDFMESWGRDKITSIKVDKYSATIHFPVDSSYLFSNFTNLKSIDFSGFDTSRVKNMSYMFLHCESLEELNLDRFNTSNVTDMSYMFAFCGNLKKVNLRSFNTSKVKYMDYMFYGLWEMTGLDLSYFNMANVTSTDYMFHHMTNLLTLHTPKNCKVSTNLPVTMYYLGYETYNKMPNLTYSKYLASSKILSTGGFDDVLDPEKWYYVPVYWAAAHDVTSGVGGSSYFKPNDDLTRAQAVAFLYKMAGQPNVDSYPEPGFKDVKNNDWFYSAVRWAVANKITSGMGPGMFQPGAKCTRAMIVTFLRNYSQNAAYTYVKPTTSSHFSDVPGNAWYKSAVDWAVEDGITSGYGTGTFRPNLNCTRAMMVSFLKKVYELPILSNS